MLRLHLLNPPGDLGHRELANEMLIGYALDGFGIYSMCDAHRRALTNVDLDACHWRTSTVLWSG